MDERTALKQPAEVSGRSRPQRADPADTTNYVQ
jgi:hypothetical protein